MFAFNKKKFFLQLSKFVYIIEKLENKEKQIILLSLYILYSCDCTLYILYSAFLHNMIISSPFYQKALLSLLFFSMIKPQCN